MSYLCDVSSSFPSPHHGRTPVPHVTAFWSFCCLVFSTLTMLFVFVADILPTNSSRTQQATSAYDRLLSPYCEDNPLDDDAVYQSYAALRDAHAAAVPSRVPAKLDGSGLLFCPVEDAAGGEYEEGGIWPAMLSQGVGMVLDYLAV